MIFLTDITAGLLDYGVLGIFCAIFIAAIAFLGKYFLTLHKKNEEKIEKLQLEHNKYLADDRVAMLAVMKDSAQALKDNAATIKNNTEVTERVLEALKNIA
jgi:ABC-type iron transport system FetAB ATPase subunit